MLMLLTKETVLIELTQVTRERVAAALMVTPDWVKITWEQHGQTGIRPRVDVKDPALTSNLVLVSKEGGFKQPPTVKQSLAKIGVPDPEARINFHTQLLIKEARIRFAALAEG